MEAVNMDQLRQLMTESCKTAIAGLETAYTSLNERMKATETFNERQSATNKYILDRLCSLEKETSSTASTYDSTERSRKHPRTEPSVASRASTSAFNDANSPLTLRLNNFPYRCTRRHPGVQPHHYLSTPVHSAHEGCYDFVWTCCKFH